MSKRDFRIADETGRTPADTTTLDEPMTARLVQLPGKISFGLAVLLILPGLISGLGVFAALLNLVFAGMLALTGRLLWPVLTAIITAVNVFVFSAFTLAANRGIGAWASVVVPFVLFGCCAAVGRFRAGPRKRQ